MSSLNNALKKEPIYTHEGAKAVKIAPEQLLRRSVLSCLLWEKEFYEDGELIANRISFVADQCSTDFVYGLAMEARHVMGLRHVPLLLLLSLIRRGGKGVKNQIANVIRRADEMTELLALYWHFGNEKDKTNPRKNHLSDRQLRDGLKLAFQKFDEYAIAKYDKNGAPIRMRDVLALTHAKPRTDEENKFYSRVMKGELKTPHTWETAISAAGSDVEKKKAAWQELVNNTLNKNYQSRDGRLGYMAVLRNIRNMSQAGIPRQDIIQIIHNRRDSDLVWPFRYLAAARTNTDYTDVLDEAMLASTKQIPKLKGTTLVVVDVSGSMRSQMSRKSDMTRMDAACALGAVIREVCDDAIIYATAGNDGTRVHKTDLVPNIRGIPLINATADMCMPLGGGGIFLNQCMRYIQNRHKDIDRVIVITDEQDTSRGGDDAPSKAPILGKISNYMINVASNRNGIGYRGTGWIHIDGFSEGIIRYISMFENETNQK